MNTDARSHVHALIDQLPPVQLAAVQMLLESMLDFLSRKLAMAPVDDEPFTQEDRQAVNEAIDWSEHNEPIPLNDILAEFGLTAADWETRGKTPLPREEKGPRSG